MPNADLPTEFEVKFYPVDKEEIVAKLKALGGKMIQAEVMTKAAFFNRNTNPQIKADYIRVRDEGDKIRLSAKVHATADGDISDQKEIDTLVKNFDSTVAILQQTGLKPSAYMEKRRETWRLGTSEVVIDTSPGLETYIEIEDDSGLAVKNTAEELGFSWQDKILTSIIEIYMDVFGLTADKALELSKHNTFADSPFKNLLKS